MTKLKMKILISILCLVAGIAAAQDTDSKLEAFFKTYLEQRFRQQPVEATKLGDHRFDSLLEDLSPPARAAWLAHTRPIRSRRQATMPPHTYPDSERACRTFKAPRIITTTGQYRHKS